MSRATGQTAGERIASAGAGTSLIGLISYLPDDFGPWKPILTVAAPTIGVGIGYAWAFGSISLRRWYGTKEIQKDIRKLNTLHKSLVDRGATDEHQKAIMDKVEYLEHLLARMITDRSDELNDTLNQHKEARQNGVE